MNKEIILNGIKIEYTHKISKRAKRLRLAVHCGGEVIVTTPRFVTQNFIEKFMLQKAEWLLNKIEQLKNVKKKPSAKESKADYQKYKDVALKIAESKVKEFNKIYNFKYNKISIKNQKTRWGSCSRKGNLNFNYKIALLSEKLANYLVVHEICHLGEFNHSKKFWTLVGKTIPDHLELRKQLKGVG
jgi:predicted metal-dependent hydrolase